MNYGKYILQGIDMENYKMPGHEGLMSFQNKDTGYQQTLTIRNLDPSKNFPESQQNSKSRHLSIIIDPLQFTMKPASKIIAKPGHDLQIELQFVNKNIIRHKSESGKGDVKIRISRTGFKIEENSPYFQPIGGVLYNDGDDFHVPVEENPRYSFEVREDDRGNSEIQTFLNLLIKDVKPEDQSFLTFEITKHPIKYTFRTELLVEPNSQMFPECYLGVWFQAYMAVPPKDEEAPWMLFEGEQNMGVCTGIGNSVSDVYLTKDGQRVDASTHESFTSQETIAKGI